MLPERARPVPRAGQPSTRARRVRAGSPGAASASRNALPAVSDGLKQLARDLVDPLMVVTLESEGVVLLNPAAERLFGYSTDEAAGLPLETLLAAPAREQLAQALRRVAPRARNRGVRATAASLELPARTKSGEEIIVELTISLLRHGTGGEPLAVLVARDTTARARAHEALRRSEERFRLLVENSLDLVAILDTQLRLTFGSASIAEVLGYTPQDLVGASVADFIHPDDLAPVREAFGRRLRESTAGGFIEFRVRHKDGSWRVLEAIGKSFQDERGVAGVLVNARDVTPRKEAEERARQLAHEQAARAEAEAAVRLRDEFLSVAAHELKTPMTSVRAYAQLLQRYLESNSPVSAERITRALRLIDHQSRSLARLVDQLLDIARLQAGRLTLERRPTDIVALVQAVVDAARVRTDAHVLAVHAPSGGVQGWVDPIRVEQVISNLVDNAIKYSPHGGEIDIAVSRPDPASVRISVDDEGIGIPVASRERVFERFHRAHDRDYRSGMGLGLYISREIVELHGGSIEIQAPAGGGTRVVVTLPVEQTAASAS